MACRVKEEKALHTEHLVHNNAKQGTAGQGYSFFPSEGPDPNPETRSLRHPEESKAAESLLENCGQNQSVIN